MRFEDYSQQFIDEENRNDELERRYDGSPRSKQELRESDRRIGHLAILENFDKRVLEPAIEAKHKRQQETLRPFAKKIGERTLRGDLDKVNRLH